MAQTVVADRDAAATLAYNLEMDRNYRSETVFSSPMIAKKKPTNQTHRGSSVRFWFTDDLAPITTPLTETGDVTPQSIGDRHVDVAITEYGATVGYTEKLLGTDMLEVNMDVATAAANQAVDSYELLARNALSGGTQVAYGGNATSTATVAATHLLTAGMIKTAVARLRAASVPSLMGGMYLAIVSPETSLDLRDEAGDAAWITAVNQQEITRINQGAIGTYGGAYFHETPRVEVVEDGGVTTTDVYKNFLLGPEALAMAYASKVSGPTPQAVIAPVTDNLRRFAATGWKWFGGFDTYREESCWRLETASSIGTNS